MMTTAWTAWTTSGGHTSLSSPTLQADGNKFLSVCFYTVILDFATETDSWTSLPVLALTVSRGTFWHPWPAKGLHPHHLSPTWNHIHNTPVLFLHEIVSQSKVSCCCCYCLTIIATFRSNFTIFGSHEPIVHLCIKCHLLVFGFP